jgi:uncharacterized membrane protein YhaH (DUF805 family)
MRCNQCEIEYPQNVKFCRDCGARLSKSPRRKSDSQSQRSSSITIGKAVELGFRQYYHFHGRATRAEFWWWILFVIAISVVAQGIDKLAGTHNDTISNGFFEGVWSLATIVPSLAVSARRLHDINRRGWWLLLWGIPFFGWILLFLWSLQQGQKGINDYGFDPRSITVEDESDAELY